MNMMFSLVFVEQMSTRAASPRHMMFSLVFVEQMSARAASPRHMMFSLVFMEQMSMFSLVFMEQMSMFSLVFMEQMSMFSLVFMKQMSARAASPRLLAALERKRIRVYKDDTNLSRWEEFGPKLLRAIETSKIAVVLVSKNYVTSKWCLDELVKIMECKRMLNERVLPIFYDVNASEVLEQEMNFVEALFNGPEEKVGSWRAAMMEVTNLAYFCLVPYW